MKATPRPWIAEGDGVFWTNYRVAKCAGDTDGEAAENARLIIAAVNSYDAMREAIAEMLLDLASSEYKTVKSFLEWSASIERARAALALAEGGAK